MAVKQKTIYGIVLAVVVITLLALSGVFRANASGESWWDQADTSWYDPVYTTFKIDTNQKLAGVAKLVNEGVSASGAPIDGFKDKVLEIDQDLDLSDYLWVPIGTEQRPFKGTLIAKGGAVYKISGMKLTGNIAYAGFIGYMNGATVGGFEFTDRGSIHIQTVGQDVYGGTGVYVGTAVGKMVNNSTVYQITNHIALEINTPDVNVYAGGIVGSGEGTIANSVNNQPIQVKGTNIYAGGIAGYGDNEGLKIKKVTNNGTVDADSHGVGDVYAGGIAGFASGALLMDEENTPIANKAAVTAVNGRNSYAGGIIAKASAEVTFSPTTSNEGAVDVNAPGASSSYAGGLVGAIAGQQLNPLFDITFTNNKPVTNHGGSNVYTGGIAGFVEGSFIWGKSYINSVNITVTGHEHVYSGGLLGKVTGDLTFNGSGQNTGVIEVSGGTQPQKPNEAYTGGLIGFAGGRVLLESTVSNAYENSGKITVSGGTGLYTGGIVSNRAYARASGEASNNVSSSENIQVNGVSGIYTGGFIGIVPNEGADKTISGAVFTKEIHVTATASDPAHSISTGGIVGYYVNGSGSGSINQSTFRGKLEVTGGGADTYTGGISGYMDGGLLSNITIGNTANDFATIASDGVVGGIAGYMKGSVDTAAVKYAALTVQTADGFAGGIAGKAQGQITGAVVGDTDFATSDSVRLAALVRNAADGQDHFTAGGIVGVNDQALTIVKSQVTKIGLMNQSGRSSYTLGAAAGFLSAAAKLGEPGVPVEIRQVNIDVKADNSSVGGAIGVNHSPEVYVKAEQIQITVPAASGIVGAIAGINDAVIADNDTEEHVMMAKQITIQAQGNQNQIGGLFGANRGDTRASLVENISITAEGTANELGGIAGRNTGSLLKSQVMNLTIVANGEKAEAGGIAGHSQANENSQVPARISQASVLAGEEALITVTGADSFAGGIVGFAKSTEIKAPQLNAVIPDYAMLSIKAGRVMAGGIAGQIVTGKIEGDALKTNIDNLLISTTNAAVDAYIGGISGYNDKTRMDKIVAKNVNLIINGQKTAVGGMAAYNQGTNTAIITSNYIIDLNIKVNTPAASSIIGGFIGINDARTGDPSSDPATAVSTIQNSRIVGNIQADAPASLTGGMVGENRSLIANNSITDKILVSSKKNDSTLGGLVGLNTGAGTLYYTYSNANLTIEGKNTLAGGLVGSNEGQIIASYVDIDITSNAFGTENGSVFLGGLVGRNSGAIEKSYSASKVTANGSYTNVGGLVGEHKAGTITNSYASKEVIANKDHSYAGGFIGRITFGTVATSYSAGQVTAANGAYAGGFAGRYDNPSKELIYKTYYVKDEDQHINKDLPDFAEGNHRFLNVHVRLSTILSATLKDRNIFPELSGWDFGAAWKYGSLSAYYKYPEVNRIANTGGDGGSGNDVNANINWYMRDKDAIYFELKTEAELAGLAAIVNGTVPGVAKFDFSGRTVRVLNPIHIQSSQWVPIGSNEEHAFQGTFAGNHHLIDGLSLLPDHHFSGLFGVIGQSGKVENVKLEPLNVAGKQFTGVLAGVNQGIVSHIDVKLLNGVKVSGGTVGGILGKNTGTLEAISLTLDGGSRIEGTGDQAIAGGIVGDNTFAIQPAIFDLKTIDGSVGSAADHATVGGLIGKQTGDVSGLKVDITASYRITSTGTNNIVGGLIGHYVSGKAEDVTLTFVDGRLEASGAASTLGGLIGQSDAGNTIKNVTVTAAQEGQHLTGNGIVGGIVGVKEGSGSNTFDVEHVKIEKVLLSTLSESSHAIVGGIAGKLTDTAISHAIFNAVIKAEGDSVTAGGIVGDGQDSILYQVEVLPDMTTTARTGENAVGGVAGIIASSDINKGFDFGRLTPLYRGIYEAAVHTKGIQVHGVDNRTNIFAGGITGKHLTASIYHSKATSDLTVNGGKSAAVGGIAGFSDGIIVSSSAQNNIHADTSSVYQVGGVVGKAAGGEIHYSNMTSPKGEQITVGSAITKPGFIPAAHVGGFVGMADQTKITNSYADIAIQVICSNQDNTIYAGGFAGLLGDSETAVALIHQAYAKGSVEVQGKTGAYAGGFAGSVDHYTITDAYSTGNISNMGFDTRSGGFAAAVERKGSIKHAYAVQDSVVTTGINHATRSYTGGFAGYNDGTLEDVFANVSNISTNVTGANAYKGAFIGYNFRDGKFSLSSYVGSIAPIGHNIGSSTEVAKVQADQINAYAFGEWNFEPDTSFLINSGAAEVVIVNGKQLAGAVLLYNDTGLDYYRLFNRTATEKPGLSKIILGADIDLTSVPWIPFAEFRGEFDGRGYRISGLKLTARGGAAANGFVSENYGKITNVIFENAQVDAGTGVALVNRMSRMTGIAAGINHAEAIISDVVIRGSSVKGSDYTGGLTGLNSGSINGVAVEASVTSTGNYLGGVTGANEGLVNKSYSSGTIQFANPELVLAVGGITGENRAAGQITQSFSYSDMDISSKQTKAGGIAGSNHGMISNTYNSGRIKAEGTEQAWAGGIAGYAAAGTISYSLNYGEVIAGVEGKIVPGKTYYGGITGQKEAAATVSHTAFNKQMLKTNTAYFDTAGSRITGETGSAAGLLGKDLVKAVLPGNVQAENWQAVQGFYPSLRAFGGSNAAKLSTVAVIFNDAELVNRVKGSFELTRDGAVIWTADPAKASIQDTSGKLQGILKSSGSAVLTAAVHGESRDIVINIPALKFNNTAAKPKVVSGDANFSNQVSVVLATDEPGGKIYYTLDGSQPDVDSLLYQGPIVLKKTTTLQAITIADEKENSEVLTGVWTLLVSGGWGGGFWGAPLKETEPSITANIGSKALEANSKEAVKVPKNSKLKLTAPAGQIIYYTTDGSTPTKNSAQFKGELLITGNMTIKAITDKDSKVITISYQVEDAKYNLKREANQIKYITGFENALFKPDTAMTRFNLVEVLAPLLDMEEVSVGSTFSDAEDGAADLIAFFASAGIIDGYPDGTFGGTRELSRAEFIVIMSRVLKLDLSSKGKTVLSDVKGHWSEKYVNAFTAAGYVEGFPDGTFKPESKISRAQAVVVINRIIGTKKQSLPKKFIDLSPSHWAYEDIMAVVK
ncbi:chitobiase/beta-hexosaminidase C-terminal domain-containing protein [Paenibacillus eucommiae]|uniref:SLH domain-containing protein n=1 Tax=Paenibacillus eucommiae TaxID=1355755 RepID=A0ABS4IWF8_9BACL|nr:chitobiase/beta-hexosaminidase C-terminal domain-containing protein [Paenibacillus eucommiae]MBP1991928.1 hypothetical protein [Paenibacillus eucommiae]